MNVYDGLSEFGRSVEYFYFVVSVIILVALFLLSLYLFYESAENVRTTGTVESELSQGVYEISYIIDGKARTGRLNGNYKIGQDIQINYDLSSKSISDYHNYSRSGSILLGVVVIGSIFAYARFYVFTKYKFLSAAEGAMTGVDIVRDVL